MDVAAQTPGNLREFSRRFATQADCEEFLFAVRYPDGFVCRRCGSRRGWSLTGRRLIECVEGHKTSLTAGTVLHASRQDLVTWFHAAYLVSTLTPGISALQFQRQLGLCRYETAFQMLHKLRSALVAPDREPLHGEVEVDESFVGGRDPDQDGRGGDKAIVCGAVEVVRWVDASTGRPRLRSGRVRLGLVRDSSAASLVPFVTAAVESRATIHTDMWSGYRPLAALGYVHRPVSQGKGRTARYTLRHIDRVFSNLKSWLGSAHRGRVSAKHLQAYLNEYTFRFNRRFWRGPAFIRVLRLLVQSAERPTYAELYKAGRPDGWVHPGLGHKPQ
jgi:transposase-like protein